MNAQIKVSDPIERIKRGCYYAVVLDDVSAAALLLHLNLLLRAKYLNGQQWNDIVGLLRLTEQIDSTRVL